MQHKRRRRATRKESAMKRERGRGERGRREIRSRGRATATARARARARERAKNQRHLDRDKDTQRDKTTPPLPPRAPRVAATAAGRPAAARALHHNLLTSMRERCSLVLRTHRDPRYIRTAIYNMYTKFSRTTNNMYMLLMYFSNTCNSCSTGDIGRRSPSRIQDSSPILVDAQDDYKTVRDR